MAAPAELSVCPNPVHAAGRVRFAQARAGQTCCSVYDAGGRRVATLFHGVLGAGRHEFDWNAVSLSPGVYVVRAEGAVSGAVRVVKAAR